MTFVSQTSFYFTITTSLILYKAHNKLRIETDKASSLLVYATTTSYSATIQYIVTGYEPNTTEVVKAKIVTSCNQSIVATSEVVSCATRIYCVRKIASDTTRNIWSYPTRDPYYNSA